MDIDLKTESELKLDFPIEYSHEGDVRQGHLLILTAPTSKNSKESAVLSQAFFRAMKEHQGGADDVSQVESADEGEGISADQAMMVLQMSDVDLGKVYESAKKLLASGVVSIEGEKKMNSQLLDRLRLDQFERLVGQYLADFIIASALARNRES